MKRLCITPCGAKKIWDKQPDAGDTRAEDVYIGAFAKACQAYAGTFFEQWVVLSAKHGVLLPDDMLRENYDVSFTSDSALVISVEMLREQWLARGFGDVEEVVVLGGKKYARAVERYFRDWHLQPRIVLPLQGYRGIGYMLQALNASVLEGRELDTLPT
ncbi:hypothetical protein JJB07_12285 [Tumebacillus sp. ITR2]|uniref:DUF6884 domain-containing protein n=1 Tax=Tumebacillus amylolyticus TaxID=2801339 RepID=A0ABS1JAX9_9BACL|nr:DUF6884 domain-containing protein [Tumebacillus amylolyticus]MBL0387432.1 hypothetical protein [Tumebacillus amylolyticus]